jgi:hypothetical protein
MGKTDTKTIRVDTRILAIGDLLIKRHPDTLSHSWFYREGVEATYEKAVNNGDNIPGDPFRELIEINNEEIANIQAATDKLTALQKKQQDQKSRTLAGSREQESKEVKKSFVFDTFHEINDWYTDTLIASDPDRFRPPTEKAQETAQA